jgi:hypothetical protein
VGRLPSAGRYYATGTRKIEPCRPLREQPADAIIFNGGGRDKPNVSHIRSSKEKSRRIESQKKAVVRLV